MTNLPITVAIPAKNDEVNLRHCLGRLSEFPEVIVIDSGSTDNTCQVAREHGATVVQFEWNGRYPKKRNWLLFSGRISQPWVLFLDADEFVTQEFCDVAGRSVTTKHYNGFWLNFTNYFLDRRLRFGVPQKKLALFRLGYGQYERIEEDSWSSLDMEVHEHPIVDGQVNEIEVPIDHRDYKGLLKFLERHKEYASWEAQRYVTVRENHGAWQSFTARQKFKYKNLAKWWYPWFYFLYAYFVKMGALDGAPGFHYAFYKAWYFHTIRLLIRENVERNST